MSVYHTALGGVVLQRFFGPEYARVNYRVLEQFTHKVLGAVSRMPPFGLKWEIVDDPVCVGRMFPTRRAAIVALQKASK